MALRVIRIEVGKRGWTLKVKVRLDSLHLWKKNRGRYNYSIRLSDRLVRDPQIIIHQKLRLGPLRSTNQEGYSHRGWRRGRRGYERQGDND